MAAKQPPRTPSPSLRRRGRVIAPTKRREVALPAAPGGAPHPQPNRGCSHPLPGGGPLQAASPRGGWRGGSNGNGAAPFHSVSHQMVGALEHPRVGRRTVAGGAREDGGRTANNTRPGRRGDGWCCGGGGGGGVVEMREREFFLVLCYKRLPPKKNLRACAPVIM